MAFIKLTGEFLNEEFNSFFSAFGFTQEIGTLVPANLTTANQFNAEFLRLYQTAAKTVGWGDNRQQIPAQETIDYQPLKIVNLWSVWADVQDKPVEKQKFYLMDNKLLFFWVPRTKQGYSFRAGNAPGRGAEFGKTAGGWFCLHRSPIADEEGNYPLKFGLPAEYTILGIMTESGTQPAGGRSQEIVKQDEFAEMEPFKGIAYNWDFQGGIIYRTYGQAGREAALGSMTRIVENMDWYACISRRSNTNFKPVKFQYPSVIAPGLRRQTQNKMSSINDKLKRTKNENSQYVGREFTANCSTERNLKILMDELEGGEFQVTYALPTASYTSQATFLPLSIGNVLRSAGLNSSLSTPASNQASSNRRMRESIEGRSPVGFTTKITFDPESCLPLFSGRTESEWKKQRTPQPSPLAHEYGNIINYNYRIPQILR